MLSKAQGKYIRSLASAKGRREAGVYVAEGDKLAREWFGKPEILDAVFCTEAWGEANARIIPPGLKTILAAPHELAAASNLQTPPEVIVTARFPAPQPLPSESWCIVCETVQDPGNLGTIIRIADWFGIGHVVCSPDCADFFSPKVVQAGMGGHLRVSLHEADLKDFIPGLKIPVFAAVMNGESLHSMAPVEAAALLIGNESRGLSPALSGLATHRITIPRRGGAESLNAAVAAGIICSALLK